MLLSLNVYFWLSALLTKLSHFLETVIFHISNVILQYFDKNFYFLIKIEKKKRSHQNALMPWS